MNVTNYTYLINKPDAITEKQTEALGSVLNEFPYFQSARALRLKGLFNQNSFKYNYALKVTAAHTSDRSVLFDFITSETFTSIQGEFYDRKLRDLLNINVFDSEIVLVEEKKKAAEIRIDPIEKSILDSIKKATTIAAFEEPVTVDEKTILLVSEQSILDSFKEVINVTFEKPVKTEETPIELPSEQSILDSFKEVTNTSIEQSSKIEEKPIDSITEQPTLDSFTEETNNSIEQSSKIEEKPIDSITEQPTLDSFKEATPIIETSPTIEIDTVIESVPVLKEPTRTFFDEIVEDEIVEEEIPKVRVEPIEESIYTSLQEASTVVFEEVPEVIEQPKEIELQNTIKTAEENLEIGRPLDFSVSEKHSFQEWLQLAKPEPIDRTNEVPKEEIQTETKVENIVENEMMDEEKKKKAEIIDKFIETNPKISPIKQTAITPAVQPDAYKEDNSYLMTETLARVYLEQKKYTKAIQAYEILILKYPEKITFFADRISDIKILQQNNNNNN
ncbi:tetratricopeptide repeat protein [Flavobacterium hydrophilum]|uniref:Tetratricopeptide repeat protein n=1 Tax=Flavobacterium hydrophilum TaxID=2211445 RepID=A0A2V4BVN8_9FLAO|nr:tetratricopeptide repeat protein [Flavobacterium hydrophilum]PXY43056.1 hypothetical protein DMB68_21905 [Flavobacterium hydrophilum]